LVEMLDDIDRSEFVLSPLLQLGLRNVPEGFSENGRTTASFVPLPEKAAAVPLGQGNKRHVRKFGNSDGLLW
jgi:hypothetical protein